MDKPHVHSWFDPPVVEGEVNSGELVTQQEGYIPAHVEIMELIKAGERLQESRGTYEFGPDEEVPEDYYDPYRDRDNDPVDLFNMVGTLSFMMKKDAAEAEKKKAEEEKAAKEMADAKAKADFDEAVEKAAAKKNAVG